MAKDVIRKENVVKYTHIPVQPKNSASDFIAQNLPLVAMFLKNKALAWACLFISLQNYLNEPYIKDPSDESTPMIFKVFFAVIAIGVSYIDLVFPSMNAVATTAANEAKDAIVDAAAAATA